MIRALTDNASGPTGVPSTAPGLTTAPTRRKPWLFPRLPELRPSLHRPGHLTSRAIIDPNTLPDRYAMRCIDNCMEPEIKDGDAILCDRTLPYASGDLVAIWIAPEHRRPGGLEAIVKRLVMSPPPWVKFPHRDHPDSELKALIIVEMLKPRRQLAYRCSYIAAIHRCLGPVPADVETVRSETFVKLPKRRNGSAS